MQKHDRFHLLSRWFDVHRELRPQPSTRKSFALERARLGVAEKPLALSFDWDREIQHHRPRIHKWTDLRQLFRKGWPTERKTPSTLPFPAARSFWQAGSCQRRLRRTAARREEQNPVDAEP